jgi:tetratricopeptide (TPR) repeat protein
MAYQSNEEGYQIISASSLGLAKKALNLSNAIARMSYVRGYWSECERVCSDAILVGKSINALADIGWRAFDLCRIRLQRNELEAARLLAMDALDAWKSLGEDRGICHVYRLLGRIAQQRGDTEEAVAFLTRAMSGYEKLGDRTALPYVMQIKGELSEQSSNIKDAAYWYQQAIDILRQDNNRGYIASMLHNLGRISSKTGDLDAAYNFYLESLQMAREIKSVQGIVTNLYSIAALELSQNQRASAESNARQALDLFRRLGMKREQADAEALLAQMSM